MPSNEFERKKYITTRENPSSSNLIWKSRKNHPKGHTKNRPFLFCIFSKDRIFHIISSKLESLEKVGFDSYGSSLIVYNSANAHIFSDEEMFNDKIDPITYNGVANIGGNDIITKGIGKFIWSWNDYEGQLKTKRLYNLLYFPDSPVNILRATALAEFTKD